MRDVLLDARYALRTLRKMPGVTAVVVLTIGLAIGANTAIFSIIDGILLNPLPYKNSGQLAMLWTNDTRNNVEQGPLSPAEFSDFQKQNTVFSDLGAIFPYSSVTLTGTGEPERLNVSVVSPSVFTILGAAAEAGRAFLPEEGQPNNNKVVVLSHGFWQRRFGSSPTTVGKAILLNNEPHTVVGIMPAWFRFPDAKIELWMPLALGEQELAVRNVRLLQAVGLLKPGVSLEKARAELSTIADRLEREHPDTNTGIDANLIPLQEQIVGGDVRRSLVVLGAAVACILLIACANVANLLLARALARNREVAIRQAIGAGRRRLVRQMLTESTILGLLGGALGLLLASWGIQALTRLSPGNIPRLDEVHLDPRALLFTILISIGAGLLFGIVPALQGSQTDLVGALKEGRLSPGHAKRRLFNLFVIVEISLALVLLSGAGLLIRSFLRLQDVQLGFQPANLLTAAVSLPRSLYPNPPLRAEFYTGLLERIGQLPSVRSAGAITSIPLGGQAPTTIVMVEGHQATSGELPEMEYRVITAGYFRAMAIPLLKGRLFTAQDREGTPNVVLINEAAARRFWPGEDPIGKRVKLGPEATDQPWLTIIGVVGAVRQFGLDTDPKPEIYENYLQRGPTTMTLVIRTSSDPTALVAALRAEVQALDQDQPIYDIRTGEQLIAESLAKRRFSTFLLSCLAVIALVLAAAGIYALMSYSVAQRTHELGLRMALGARRADALRLVLGNAITLTVTALVIGLVAAFALTRVMQSLLFETSSTDPSTFATVLLTLFSVALLACFVPAYRATKVDPLTALRYD